MQQHRINRETTINMPNSYIEIQASKQLLRFYQNNKLSQQYPISTAKNGLGELNGSEKTPLGWHVIRAKIGAGCPINTVFNKRRPTGEIYSEELAKKYPPGRDWILTRILWLSGLEIGKNRLGNVDTMRRYIYIHGCPDTSPINIPLSRGCVRMRNQDLIALFDQVTTGTKVLIEE